MHFEYTGDTISIENNTITSGSGSTHPGIYLSQIAGAGGTRICHNTIVSAAGCIIVDSGVTPYIANNTLEQITANTEANGAMIDIKGSVLSVMHPQIINNAIQVIFGVAGTCTPIRVDAATNPTITGNRLSVRGANKHVITTANCANCVIDCTNVYVIDDVITLDIAITDSSTSTLIFSQVTNGGYTISGGGGVYVKTGIYPLSSGTSSVGSGALPFANLYLKSTGTVDFGNGNVSIVHATGALTTNGSLKTSSSGGLGYATGAGGTVTQTTSKSTGVTLNKTSGTITMHNALLGAGITATFVVTNSTVAATDTIILNWASGGTANAYSFDVVAVGAGSFSIRITNITAGALGEAPVINFTVIKGVTS